MAHGLGFVHALDRYYQMDLNKRIANGALCELMGPEFLSSDRFFKTMGFSTNAKSIYDSLDSSTKDLLDAYVTGINDYIDTNPKQTFEMRVYAYAYVKWTVYDSIAVLKLYQYRNSGNIYQELLRFRFH
jgi:penicillin G amidase